MENLHSKINNYAKLLSEQYPKYTFKLAAFYAGMGYFGLSIIVGTILDSDKLCGIDVEEFNDIKQYIFKAALSEDREWYDFELRNGEFFNEFYVKNQQDEYIPVHITARGRTYQKTSQEFISLKLEDPRRKK